MSSVLIAGPVRQKPAILREFLQSLDRLEKKDLEISYAFIDDHVGGSEILKEFAACRDNARIIPAWNDDSYLCDENTHHWRADLIRKVAGYKDRLIEIARGENFDFLFLVDSDLVLHPKTLVHLAGLGKDIVSEVFWTRWETDMIPLPQVWVGDQYRLHYKKSGEALDDKEIGRRTAEFLDMLKRPGTYRVGGLGACTLISRKAISSGVSFREIYNLDLTGEDRHFCVRAAALGLELYADTHYPPYHIYRESELTGLNEFKKSFYICSPDHSVRGNRITLAMLVRNEADRYLEKVLRHAARYIDSAVILDDASEDSTVEVCRKALEGIPLVLVSNSEPSFKNEVSLRKQHWELTLETNPDWVLLLDADEMFEERAVQEIKILASNPGVEVYSFRLYDMWNEENFRDDRLWSAHQRYWARMVRFVPGFPYRWLENPLHCGGLPRNIHDMKAASSSLRIKHFGWMKPADRLTKYYRYKKADPEGKYGNMDQYLSILDPKPRLTAWSENENGSINGG